jgi:hypothetical protein
MAEAPAGGTPEGGTPASGGAPSGGNAAPWHGITDATEAAYVANKGWQSPADVIKSYQGAEKLIGRDPNTMVALPRLDDPAGFRAVMSKLGLPETADKYDLGKPAEGQPAFDDNYLGWARNTFHELGLPASVAKALVAKNTEYVAGVMKQQAEDYQLSVTNDKATLQREWGGGYERMMNAATTAGKALGFTTEMIDSMEKSIGYAGTMKFMAGLGQKLGESGFVGAESSGNGANSFSNTLTPAEAKAQWQAMLLDPTATAALRDAQHPGHKAAKEKQTMLFGIMYKD